MRCKNCNVDLPDSYKVCPLCHGEAVDEPAFLNLPEAEYPPVYKAYKRPRKSDLPVKYAIRAGVVLSVLLGVISLFAAEWLWFICVPAIMVSLAVACVIGSFFEKSTLLHNFVALMTVVCFQILFLIVSLIAGTEILFMLIGTGICVLLFVFVFVTKTERAKAQLQALFCL